MSLNAVQIYAKNELSKLGSSPFWNQPEVYIAPPRVGTVARVPHIYIWGSVWDDNRQTAPRKRGFIRSDYQVQLWLRMIMQANDPDADMAFPAFIKTVQRHLQKVNIAVPITDPVDNEVSQLLAIGEKYHVEYIPVHTTANQRIVQYDALVRATVRESTLVTTP